MRRRPFFLYGMGMLLLCLLFAVSCPGPKAEAASRLQKLKIGKTYALKLDGKKKSKVLCTYTPENSGTVKLNIYIDGKKQTTLDDWAFKWDVALCRITAARNLLYVRDSSDNDWCNGMRIFEYKAGKFKQLENLARITRDDQPLSNWSRGKLVRVKKNRFTAEWHETAHSTGILRVFIDYKISGQKITKIGKIYEVKTLHGKNSWTAKRDITVYAKAGGHKKAFTMKNGEKVKITGITVKNKKRYLRVKNAKGKTGWYQDPSDYPMGGWFKEAFFAG